MADPLTIAATTAVVGSAVGGFKGNQSAAANARAMGDYNAAIAQQEKELLRRKKIAEEAALRESNSRVFATQNVATAASGIEMSGSPYLAAADAFFNTEMDALNIQYAADIEALAKTNEANLARAEGRARQKAFQLSSYQSLLSGGAQAAQTYTFLS
tara:strand:+ start:1219 stop:1689 length:471 start_codon:yes stop_codon:yes gene_type:complete